MSLNFIKTDTMGRKWTFQLDKETSPVIKGVLLIKRPFEKEDGVQVFDEDTTPSISEIGNGKVFDTDSNKLGITKDDQGYYSFRDGIVEAEFHLGFDEVFVTGSEGDFFAIGTGLQQVFDNFDSVLIGEDVFTIDKSKSTNAGTVLYFDKELPEDITSMVVSKRYSTKVLSNLRTKTIIAKSAHILSNDYPSSRYRILEKENGILKVIKNKIASEIFYEQEDFIKADFMLRENVQIGYYLGVL